MPRRDTFNHLLDRLVRPEFCALNRPWCAFHICGGLGLALAIVSTMALVVQRGLSPWMTAGIVVTAVLTFLGLVMATKITTGEERIIYYHHELAVTGAAALLLWLFEQPLLPYLDVTILGIGMFLACGRIGCFMVGCCYGRPCSWGVCYGEEHAAVGFSRRYLHERLFPIQVVESLWVLAIVFIGGIAVWRGAPAGWALAWYGITYGLGRFGFEYLRGDPGRPHLRGFSEAQWLAFIHIGVIVSAELCGVLALHLWHVGALVSVTLVMIGLSWRTDVQTIATHRRLDPHPLTGEV